MDGRGRRGGPVVTMPDPPHLASTMAAMEEHMATYTRYLGRNYKPLMEQRLRWESVWS
jgi:hypothetical protein